MLAASSAWWKGYSRSYPMSLLLHVSRGIRATRIAWKRVARSPAADDSATT